MNDTPIDRRSRIAVPDGMTPEEFARKGLAVEEAEGIGMIEAAAIIGVGKHAYRMMRDLVLLKDHGGLNARDTALANAAVSRMNRELRAQEAHGSVRDIIDRLWGQTMDSSPRHLREQKRNDAFDLKIGIVMNTCVSAAEFELPYLSKARAKKAVQEIKQARRELLVLLDRIKGVHGDD